MRAVVLAALSCLATAASPAAAQVYVGTSGNGSVVLSNFVSVETPKKLVLESEPTAAAAGTEPASAASLATDVGSIVLKVAQEVDVSPYLLHAVIAVESAYDVRAVSPKGAQGLMQLMPATSQRFGVRDPFDPHENVRGGARYLKTLLALFKGDLQLTLAAYNAGENAVVRYGNRVPPFAETQKYVPKVIARMQRAARS
jgi:soluble lytic murein transglycosylase-like protein